MDQFSNGDIFVGEIIGTAILILLGSGVCAAVNLRFSKAKDADWIVVAFGWGFGVMAGAYSVGTLSGGHLNPAVTLGIAIKEGDNWEKVPVYIAGQMIGALIGAGLCYVAYYAQFEANRDRENASPTLGIFSTAPELRNPVANLLTEVVATLVLVLPLLAFAETKSVGAGPGQSGLGTLLVAFLVVGIGLSLGGPTGYAINPARDLGPRIAHALLPIPNKGTSDWGYAWIPVAGPLIGGALGALVYELAF
ncbi:MIP/aquaporin family protein [Streptomyces sp. NPDC048172]|uniref:MIP/aquaporin family protein n=1 Tax=Streptomyces sp. NPDC048172 TaxID=3365505 RepID=UPI00371AF0A1